MRIVINLVLFLLTLGLIYLLYTSIFEPIKFRTEKNKRQAKVVERLVDIRKAQEMYVNINEVYAKNFDALKASLDTGKFMFLNVKGDPDDPDFVDFSIDTTYAPAKDSVRSIGLLLDSLRFVPYGGGSEFSIFADTLGYEGSLVNVIEVGTTYKEFMGKYADPKYARYDNRYDPNKTLKFGDRNKPIVTGNWEQ